MLKETIKLEEWFVTPSQFAKKNGLSRWGVNKAILEGRLLATRIGNQWLIPVNEFIRPRRKG